jgi:hypothetical protein
LSATSNYNAICNVFLNFKNLQAPMAIYQSPFTYLLC